MDNRVCSKCGVTLTKGIKYCPNCGSLQEEKSSNVIICKDCKQEIPSDSSYCPNCGCPVKEEHVVFEVPSKELPQKEKKSTSGILKICILALLALAILTVGVYFGKKPYADHKKLSEADALFDSGKYSQALYIYNNIEGSKKAILSADRCNYELGKAAMESHFWEYAKKYFLSIQNTGEFDDLANLISQCDEELKHTGFIDNEFLEEMKNVVSRRIERGFSLPSKYTIKFEAEILDRYSTANFQDSKLAYYATEIVRYIKLQETALENDNRFDSQEQYCAIDMKLAEQICNLYDEYGFMENDNGFITTYILDRNAYKDFYEHVHEINLDIINSLNETDSWKTSSTDYFLLYQNIHNKTSATITVKYYYYGYNEDETQLLFSDTYTAEKIPPKKDYRIYLDLPRNLDYAGELSILYDWEVLDAA